jgi:ribosome biogenesis GTPase / thiamine phosphate phosphatase
MLFKGKVVKILAGKYWVLEGNTQYLCSARGALRNTDQEILVGDNVSFEKAEIPGRIIDVLPRKNYLGRPPVANIDDVLIVVAKEPKPDFVLVDKILINSYSQRIRPILCYNKIDLVDPTEVDSALSGYGQILDTIAVSAETGFGLSEIENLIKGRSVCLAGQSAVGKTSMLNAILGLNLKTGELSDKIKRGKNTTRHVEIFKALGAEIVDTCGFSMLENLKIHESELGYYYPDFLDYSERCRFKGCTHISEPSCGVKEAVEKGLVDKERYERYIKIYNEIKDSREKEFS